MRGFLPRTLLFERMRNVIILYRVPFFKKCNETQRRIVVLRNCQTRVPRDRATGVENGLSSRDEFVNDMRDRP